MKKLILLSLILGAGAFAAVAQTAEDEVRAARAAWDEAYSAGDLDRLMELYTEDAVSMAPGFPASVGREAIEADLGGFLAEHDTQHDTDIQDIVVEGDLALERAAYTDEITPRGGEAFTEHGKHIVVYRRGADGAWRVLWEIWNTNEAPGE